MTEAKCNFRKINSTVNSVACSIKGNNNEETQEHMFNCDYLSTNKTGEDLSEIFENYWNTKMKKVLVKHFMINMKAKEKIENHELITRKHGSCA